MLVTAYTTILIHNLKNNSKLFKENIQLIFLLIITIDVYNSIILCSKNMVSI